MRILTDKEIEKQFGKFKYKESIGGQIIIEKDWIENNIVYEKIPIIGSISCHKKVLLRLFQIFYEIEFKNLSKEIDVLEFKNNIAGCFVPRHKNWCSSKGLSRHSWGIAIDINVRRNPYGKPPIQHPAVVSIFEKYGFYWGGRWKFKDGMHFEVSDQFKPLTMKLLLDTDDRI